jgi:FkbM family methyltransferase
MKLLGKKFFGLDELDKKLLPYLNFKDGFFVELGANDGIVQSNTKHLELYRGWRGILVEPSPQQFSKLIKYRSRENHFFNCACVGFTYPKMEINLMYSNLMSIALEGVNDIEDRLAHAKIGELHSDREKAYIFSARAKTLQSILVEANSPSLIDLLSLDVEGGELEVLNGINFDYTNFKYIIIETRSISKVREFLIPKFYEDVAQLSHHDYLFRWKKM